jgi:outer membrane protein assembly factor BamD
MHKKGAGLLMNLDKRNAFAVFLFLVCCGAFVLGCNKNKKGDSLLDYTRTAKLLFQEAMDEFEDDNCVEAEPLFEDVKKKYPYSGYATLSELRIADCKFIQENHAEAAELYQEFTKAHPTHEEAHYAAYRRGLSYYKMIPGDWVITPPPYERDQSSTRDARAAFTQFIERYPKSPWRERAITLNQKVEDALVDHEIYVALFYLRHDDRRAATVRLDGIQNAYPKSNKVPDALFLRAITFLEMNQVDDARKVFSEIIRAYPHHHQSLRARDYLAHLEQGNVREKRGGDGQ